MNSEISSLRTNRLYGDLSWLWPMWGDPATEYRSYCDHVGRLFKKYARREVVWVLNVGCGGGKNVFNLKREFEVTGLDISPAMLALARELNPACTFVEGDMRDFAIQKRFDAVLIDDAVAYITTEDDLRRVFENAYEHLSAGGVMLVGPDETRETFEQNKTSVWQSQPHLAPRGIEVTYIVNSYDPDPSDTCYESAMVFLIRDDGNLRVEQDRHILGLFSLDRWKAILSDVGFELHEEQYTEGSKCFAEFACVKLA